MHPVAAAIELELAVPPADVAALRRLAPGLGRARPVSLIWHDDDARSLAGNGLALLSWREGRRTGWRAEALVPGMPGAPVGALAASITLEALAGIDIPPLLLPVQEFSGRVRDGRVGAVALRLTDGALGSGEQLARLRLSGPGPDVLAMARALAEALRLDLPLVCLSAEALLRSGAPIPARRLGAPELDGTLDPGAAFARAAGHLLGVMLHHAPAAAAGRTGEPVHQMRVALRRLRALASVFREAVACPELEAVRTDLKTLASALGPARDWDVFLAGTGREVDAAFPGEPELSALLAAAEARRSAAYASLAVLLTGPALRHLALQLAVLVQSRPWEAAAIGDLDLRTFASAVLSRRARQVVRHAKGIADQPEAALHELRLRAKRLRYAAEAFAPLFPGRGAPRFLKRLSALQDTLGHLNDGAVASQLMQALAAEGGTTLAGGLVRGFVAGRGAETRARVRDAWKRLRREDRFWS